MEELSQEEMDAENYEYFVWMDEMVYHPDEVQNDMKYHAGKAVMERPIGQRTCPPYDKIFCPTCGKEE